jgi:hypothetical protein
MNVDHEVERLEGQCDALSIMLGAMLFLLQPSLAADLVRQLEALTEEMHANALADPNASDRSIESCARTIGIFLEKLRVRATGQGMPGHGG